MKYKTVYFAGYAQLPSNISVSTAYRQFTLSLKINIETDIIEDADCTLITTLAKSFIKEYFIGHHVLKDYDSIVDEISFRHQGTVCKSIIKSYGDICRNYEAFKLKNQIPFA